MPLAITKGTKKVQNVNNSAPNTWGGVHFAVARSEQYPGVNNIPKGLTCIHPEVCSTFMAELFTF